MSIGFVSALLSSLVAIACAVELSTNIGVVAMLKKNQKGDLCRISDHGLFSQHTSFARVESVVYPGTPDDNAAKVLVCCANRFGPRHADDEFGSRLSRFDISIPVRS